MAHAGSCLLIPAFDRALSDDRIRTRRLDVLRGTACHPPELEAIQERHVGHHLWVTLEVLSWLARWDAARTGQAGTSRSSEARGARLSLKAGQAEIAGLRWGE